MSAIVDKRAADAQNRRTVRAGAGFPLAAQQGQQPERSREREHARGEQMQPLHQRDSDEEVAQLVEDIERGHEIRPPPQHGVEPRREQAQHRDQHEQQHRFVLDHRRMRLQVEDTQQDDHQPRCERPLQNRRGRLRIRVRCRELPVPATGPYEKRQQHDRHQRQHPQPPGVCRVVFGQKPGLELVAQRQRRQCLLARRAVAPGRRQRGSVDLEQPTIQIGERGVHGLRSGFDGVPHGTATAGELQLAGERFGERLLGLRKLAEDGVHALAQRRRDAARRRLGACGLPHGPAPGDVGGRVRIADPGALEFAPPFGEPVVVKLPVAGEAFKTQDRKRPQLAIVVAVGQLAHAGVDRVERCDQRRGGVGLAGARGDLAGEALVDVRAQHDRCGFDWFDRRRRLGRSRARRRRRRRRCTECARAQQSRHGERQPNPAEGRAGHRERRCSGFEGTPDNCRTAGAALLTAPWRLPPGARSSAGHPPFGSESSSNDRIFAEGPATGLPRRERAPHPDRISPLGCAGLKNVRWSIAGRDSRTPPHRRSCSGSATSARSPEATAPTRGRRQARTTATAWSSGESRLQPQPPLVHESARGGEARPDRARSRPATDDRADASGGDVPVREGMPQPR